MTEHTEITEREIRDSLIKRAEAFCISNKTSFSAIGIAAVKDSKFLSRVKGDAGFNIKTYQRMVEWLDAAEKDAVA